MPRGLLHLAPSNIAQRPELPWLGSLGMAAALVLAFGWLAEEMVEGDASAFDRRVIQMFRNPGDPAKLLGPDWLPETVRDVTSLGSTAVLGIVLTVVVGYLLMSRQRASAVFALASVLGGQVLSTLLKSTFARPRPDLVPGAPEVFTASFPSGHAMLSAVTYLTLAALLARMETRWTIRWFVLGVGILITVLVGVSRVALGVHWPSDVLAGWCVGAAWAILCASVALRFVHRGKTT